MRAVDAPLLVKLGANAPRALIVVSQRVVRHPDNPLRPRSRARAPRPPAPCELHGPLRPVPAGSTLLRQNLTTVPIRIVRGGTRSSTALKYWFGSMLRKRLPPPRGRK